MRLVSAQDLVTVYNHKSNETSTTTVYKAVNELLARKNSVLEMLDSKDIEVTVKLNSDGTVKAVILSNKESNSSSDDTRYCSCVNDALLTAREDALEKMGKKWLGKIESMLNKTGQEIEDDPKEEQLCWLGGNQKKMDKWWKNKTEDKLVEEDEVDLDLTLEWDGDVVNRMEETLIPDVIEATQLPPETISGILHKQDACEDDILDTNSAMEVDTDEEQLNSDDDEIWKECWNCKAPRPIDGIYRDDPDNLRIRFCCEKPCRVKPTNTAIEWGPKSYPYDSWVNHGVS